MKSSQKPPQAQVKTKPPTSQSLQRPVQTQPSKEKEQEQQEMDQDEIQARNMISEKIEKALESRNNQQWENCFENLFVAFKINENYVNDAQLSSDILSQIGFAHWNRGDLDSAIEFYENALKLQIKYAKKDHPDIASTYCSLGTVYLDRKNYAKSIQYLEKALKIQEQQLNPNHPDLISTYSNLGSALFGKDDYLKALEYFRKSQKIEEKIYGMEDIYLTGSLKNIAVIYQTMGEYGKALPVLERELKIKQKNLDKNNVESKIFVPFIIQLIQMLLVGYNLVDISVIKEMKEDYQGALIACEDGLQILQQTLSSQDQKLKQCEERCQVLKQIVESDLQSLQGEEQSMKSHQSQKSLPSIKK